jgi:hypothetical protein
MNRDPDPDDVRALYAEVGASWRQLTEVRFKLLAFLPLVSGIGLFQLLNGDSAMSDAPKWGRFVAAAFGAIITCALWIYDRRNTEVYSDLVHKGKQLEETMQLGDSGAFHVRTKPHFPVKHGVALKIVYWATLIAWLIVCVAVMLTD